MGNQQKIVLAVLAIIAILAAAGVGLRYGTDIFGDPQVVGKADEQKLAAVPPEKVEPEEDAKSDEADVPAGPADKPSFDIVRVESTGELVAAGRSSAGARVELMSGDDTLAQAEANTGGEWALVVDEPLAPGSYDLLLRATGENGEGDMIDGDRVTIVIESPDRTPLVAVARPGEPMEVVQQPESDTETMVAEAPKSEAPTADTPKTMEESASSDTQSGSQTTSDTAASADADQSTQPDQQDEADAGQSDQAGEPATQPDDADTQVAAASGGTDSGDTTSGDDASDQPAAGANQASAQSDQDQSGQDQPAQEAAAEAPATGTPTADTKVAGVQTAGSQTAEAQGTGTEAALSTDPDKTVVIETFEVENSDRLMLSGRADPGDAVRIYLNDDQLADVETDENGRWTLSADHPIPPGRYTVRADLISGTGDVVARAQVRFDRVQMVAEGGVQQPAAGGNAAQGTEAGQGSDSGQSGSAVTIVSRGSGVGTASSGDTVGAGAGTSVVVIAHGDNLWHIARKIYGQGIRHSVIYEANRNQIRDPHLIYPGQVFTIPVLDEENG